MTHGPEALMGARILHTLACDCEGISFLHLSHPPTTLTSASQEEGEKKRDIPVGSYYPKTQFNYYVDGYLPGCLLLRKLHKSARSLLAAMTRHHPPEYQLRSSVA